MAFEPSARVGSHEPANASWGIGSMVVKRAAMLLVALTLAACGLQWEEAERFRKSLHCGLTIEQVRKIAAKNGVDDLPAAHTDPDVKNLIVAKGRQLFRLTFKAGHLVAVQKGRYTGVDGVKLDEPVKLCP
jgi:hypothetical protein